MQQSPVRLKSVFEKLRGFRDGPVEIKLALRFQIPPAHYGRGLNDTKSVTEHYKYLV